MHAVINHFGLAIPPERLVPAVEGELLPLLRGLEGFEGFYLVREPEGQVCAILLWDTEEHAVAGGQAIGPTWFRAHVAPHLTSEQRRTVGEVLARG